MALCLYQNTGGKSCFYHGEDNFQHRPSEFRWFLRNRSTNFSLDLHKIVWEVKYTYQSGVLVPNIFCNGSLWVQCHILILHRMFKGTSSGYRVVKLGACNYWWSPNYYNIKYPLKLQEFSNFRKKYHSSGLYLGPSLLTDWRPGKGHWHLLSLRNWCQIQISSTKILHLFGTFYKDIATFSSTIIGYLGQCLPTTIPHLPLLFGRNGYCRKGWC